MQRRATKYILNSKLPFCCDTDNKTRPQMTKLLPLSYWHEYHDIVFFYKAVNNLIYVNKEVLPVVRNVGILTESSSSIAVSFIPKKCNSHISAFFLCKSMQNLECLAFTKLLRNYYIDALAAIYDQDDIRTWKTSCPRCNSARALVRQPLCLFLKPLLY